MLNKFKALVVTLVVVLVVVLGSAQKNTASSRGTSGIFLAGVN
jgi:hypothetical protein